MTGSHPPIISQNNLALLYSAMGKTDEALAMHEEVLRVRREIMEPEHPDVLVALNNLASSYGSANRSTEAVGLLEEAAATAQRVHGPTSH